MSVVLQKLGAESGTKLPCDATVDVGDYVYIRADGVLDKALADDISTMPAIGKVVSKPNATTCVFKDKLIDEDYSGVTPKQEFFISSTVAGSIQDFPPEDPSEVSQMIGFGVDTEKIYIDIDPTNVVVRS